MRVPTTRGVDIIDISIQGINVHPSLNVRSIRVIVMKLINISVPL